MAVIIQDIAVPHQQSTSLGWINYHRALKRRFGKNNAKALFLHTWQLKGNTSLPSSAEFDEYFTAQDIDLKDTWDNIVTGARSAGEGLGMFTWVLGLLLGAAALSFLFGLFRMLALKPDAAFSAAFPAGRALKYAKTAKRI